MRRTASPPSLTPSKLPSALCHPSPKREGRGGAARSGRDGVRLWACFFFLCCLLSLTSCTSDPEEPPYEGPTHTLVVFMPWADRLAADFDRNLTDLEAAFCQSRPQGQRILLVRALDIQNARLYEIKRNGKTCTRTSLKAYTTPSLTTTEGLARMLNDCRRFAPADNYAMVIGGHGMGWLPAGTDMSTVGAPPLHAHTRFFGDRAIDYQIDCSSLADAVSATGLTLDYILFDMCYMGSVEALYTLRHSARYLIASPTEVMSYGFPYLQAGACLFTQPDIEGLASAYLDFYTHYVFPYGTLAVIRSDQLENLASLVREAQTKHSLTPEDIARLQPMDALSPTLFFDLGDYLAALCHDDAPLLGSLNAQMELTVPVAVHTRQYYTDDHTAHDIRTFSGLTTSVPSTSPLAAGKENTEWYRDTH